ncbi:hypothetical protein DPX16_7897 [Anabarilius grahami]|uniref:Uncharacterized protein n=1 Tax=Anabarilius grahami TaxID=495550 RepID=A0A3N0Y8Y6_ANAGA|nr:hypothetical protein DPX16_7897 [Anabarilius grahami]
MTEVNNAVEPSVTEEDVRLLIKRKEEIEEQIKAYYDMLQADSFALDARYGLESNDFSKAFNLNTTSALVYGTRYVSFLA